MPVTYKCPACGGAMEFDSSTQKLTCQQCGQSVDVNEFESSYKQDNEQYQQGSQNSEQNNEQNSEQNNEQNNDANGMKMYYCSSCGAELVADKYTSATICAFCGNPSLVENRLKGDFKPSYIIPFKYNKDQAVNIYRGWAKKGLLTPKFLLEESTIEKITGVYVPFWLYNYHGQCQMNAAATRVRRRTSGNTEYVYTDHYSIYRDFEADFRRIPADASEKMPDKAMDMLEPFNYEEMEDFSMPYLSGYLSERYNYTDLEMEPRVRARADEFITDMTRDTIRNYDSVTVLNKNVMLQNTSNEYTLFPVWIMSYRYKGENRQFMLNGQTGKIVAKRPISNKKTIVAGLITFISSMLICMLGGLLIWYL